MQTPRRTRRSSQESSRRLVNVAGMIAMPPAPRSRLNVLLIVMPNSHSWWVQDTTAASGRCDTSGCIVAAWTTPGQRRVLPEAEHRLGQRLCGDVACGRTHRRRRPGLGRPAQTARACKRLLRESDHRRPANPRMKRSRQG